MMLAAILIGVLIFFDIIMAFTLGLAGKPHKNIILENTLPKEVINDSEVKTLAKKYRVSLWQIAGIFSVLNLSMLLTQYESILMTLFWLLLLVPMGLFYGIEISYIRQMAQLKAKKGWQLPVSPTLIDTKLTIMKNKKALGFSYLVPAFLLTLLLVFAMFKTQNDGALIFSVSVCIGWLISFLLWYGIRRLPVAAPTSNERINRAYNDLTKHDWSIVAVGTSYIIILAMAMPFLASQLKGIWVQVIIWALLILICSLSGLLVWYLIRLRKKQDALLAQVEQFRYQGEDQYWRFGVYNNPSDHRLMIPDRIGLNITMNLGRPAGKIFMSAIGLLVIGILFATLIPIYIMDFNKEPFQAELKESTLVLKAPFATTSTIALAAIQEVTLTDSLKGSVERTSGYGGDNYNTGYYVVNDKKATLYLDKRSKPFLKISTKNRDYYFTFKQPKATKQLYQKLQKTIK